MKKLRRILPILTLVALFFIVLSTSCDKRNPPVIVTPPPPPPDDTEIRVIAKISADRDTIYADNNYTFARISVLVKDGLGFAVSNQSVQFKANIGKILTTVFTDSTGVATTTFWDNQDLGTATIDIKVQNYSTEIADSLLSEVTGTYTIQVVPVPEVASIDFWELPITPGTTDKYLPMPVMQVTSLRARVKDERGNDVADNTMITFITNRGDFIDANGNIIGDRAIAKTINGRASITYQSGTAAGTGLISAGVYRDGQAVAYDEATLVISPGLPFGIQLKAYVQDDQGETESYTSPVNSTNLIKMRAVLTDTHGNFCPSIPVKFTTTLGTFLNTTNTTNANTNNSGMAEVRFTPGLQAGAATITASANNDTLRTQINFNVSSDQIHSISFAQAGQISLNVANTGGQSSAVIRVHLKDINGNLIDTPKQVSFRILNNDIDANLNNQPTNATVTVTSTGGEALVSVNSGFQSGTVTLRATCVDEGTTIQATKSNIVVLSGPPATIQPFISGFNTGVNAGGGLWTVSAGAIVRDVHNNPVENDTSVFFSIPYNPYNVQINGSGFTGNVSVTGDSLRGVAYTTVTYSGINTFDTIVIEARSGSFDSNGNYVAQLGVAAVILPLNDPILELQSVPGHLDFSEQPAPSPWANINSLVADIWASVVDSQGNLIHGAKILLYSSNGTFIYSDPWNMDFNYPNHNWPANDYHIVQTGLEGMALGKIRLWRHECPPPPDPATPGVINVQIFGRILGTTMTAQTGCILYRYPSLPYLPPSPPPLG